MTDRPASADPLAPTGGTPPTAQDVPAPGMATGRSSEGAAARDPDALPPGLAVADWLARHHDMGFSRARVEAALPAGLDGRDPAALARILGAAGFATRLVRRTPRQIDPAVLPCVLFPRDGSAPILLSEIAAEARTATLRRLDNPTLAEEIRLRDLARLCDRQVLLVTPDDPAAARRLSPATRAEGRAQGHWFWGAVRANSGAFVQVIVAAFFLNLLNLALPLFVMNVYDRVIPNLAYVTLWTLAAGVGIALALDLALRLLRGNILDALARRVDLRVGADLFRQAMQVQLLTRPGGAAGIANRIRDFETVREFFASATFVSLIDLAFIGIFIAALFWIVGPVAWVPLLAVPLVIVLALVAQVPIARNAGQAVQLATKRHVVLMETLSGIEAVKSLNAQPVMQREWEGAVAASARLNARARFWSAFATHTAMLTTQVVSVGIIVWGVFLVAAGEITIGGLIAANILAGRVLAPLTAISQTIFRAQYAVKSMAALTDFMRLPVEGATPPRVPQRLTRGAVELRDVSYTYPGSPVKALDRVSLHIPPGEVVALLGRVGSGKSTLGRLLAGLVTPQEGLVLADGTGLGQYHPADLRDGIGYLPQEPQLFSGTLLENLVMGRPGATSEEIAHALHHAGLDGFVAATPEGLNLDLGERGGRLSGGQRQALALARLILRRPRVLFLDEPTSAMDQQMEAQVIARLRALGQGDMTLILCTHRQSLAALADRFVVMEAGRKVLDGPRAQILARLNGASAGKGGADAGQ
ncbi:type I secretion system permease/ATPase [Pseudooceanicola aestuarii]|uniref:type I secretion system permease/ATPase n=1 Tax=Pseudooceanicola aestuarii TaxID=2697319 RepID=UPI0013D2311F|nr:type I secretion system permease/ATPase [Pseudooceanicola aestuarii]